MAQMGHFGMPAIIAAGAALVLLVVHLAVPYGILDYNSEINASGTEDETLSRGETKETFEAADGYGPASPGLTLTGAIMALIAGTVLVVASFAPVPVLAGRFIGWGFGLVGALGAFFSLTSSAYWVGTGFTTFLRAAFSLFNAEAAPAQRLWIIGPVLSLLLAGFACWMFVQVMANVVAKRDGLRSQAMDQINAARTAAIFLVAVLVLPWSLQVANGDDRIAMGICDAAAGCPASYTFFSAFGHGDHEIAGEAAQAPFGGIMAIAEATDDAEPGLFQGLAFSLKVLTAVGWLGFLLCALATVGPLLSSAFKLPGAARFTPLVQALNLPMLAWGAIMFLLASAYMWSPSWDNDASFGSSVDGQSWWYGFFPLLAAWPMALFALNQWQSVREVFAGMGVKISVEQASFD